MNNQERKIIEQAIEFIESGLHGNIEVISNLKSLLEQDEPVAWMYWDTRCQKRYVQLLRPNLPQEVPLYTAPHTTQCPECIREAKAMVERLRPLYADGDAILDEAANLIERLAGIKES